MGKYILSLEIVQAMDLSAGSKVECCLVFIKWHNGWIPLLRTAISVVVLVAMVVAKTVTLVYFVG